MFLFLSLAFLKRYAELTGFAAGEADILHRRGYQRRDREWLGAMGGASGYLAVLVLALYINSDQVMVLYQRPLLLWLICPLLLFWISRMWLLAYRGEVDDDPILVTVARSRQLRGRGTGRRRAPGGGVGVGAIRAAVRRILGPLSPRDPSTHRAGAVA